MTGTKRQGNRNYPIIVHGTDRMFVTTGVDPGFGYNKGKKVNAGGYA